MAGEERAKCQTLYLRFGRGQRHGLPEAPFLTPALVRKTGFLTKMLQPPTMDRVCHQLVQNPVMVGKPLSLHGPCFVANQPVLHRFWGLTLRNRGFGLPTPCFAQTLPVICGGFGGVGIGSAKLTRSNLNGFGEGLEKTNLPFSRLTKILYLGGENFLQNAHCEKQKWPCLKPPVVGVESGS